jgi:tetratricopeptide (TPR) repeat protein
MALLKPLSQNSIARHLAHLLPLLYRVNMRTYLLSLTLLITPLMSSQEPSSSHVSFLYHSLDPLSIVENLAFYELYPKSPEGDLALKKAWGLLCGGGPISSSILILPKLDLQAVVSLTTRQPSDPPIDLSDEQLQVMNRISGKFANRQLKGSTIWTEEELVALPLEEIDLGRALLIYQFKDEPDPKKKILQYEASIDLMALQIQARLQDDKTDRELIRQINQFIFREMGFRYPPLSVHTKDIDLYTFLPSVLDSRRGVCLGVSILYLCLAQRLSLNLEVITPPGHIYVRYPLEDGELNIETTARGVNLPSETYLGVNTRYLQKKNIREVIGMAFANHAAVHFGRGEYKEAVDLYERASIYMQNDPWLDMLLGINYVLLGEKAKGKKVLAPITPLTFDYAVSEETIPSDYLNGKIDANGMKAIFMPVDENRSSILEKQKELKTILKKYPEFRAGLLQLATTYLQLGKTTKALKVLLKYDALDPNDATVEYYLSILSLEKLDYQSSWKFLKKALSLTDARDHNPRALKGLAQELRKVCPDPSP